MSYEPHLLRAARKDLAKLEPAAAQRILRAIAEFAGEYEDRPRRSLTGNLRGSFRLRVGDYRVIYTADHERKRMVVHFIRHRREVYR